MPNPLETTPYCTVKTRDGHLMKPVLCLLSFLLISSFLSYSQDFSNKGKEFWIAYPSHIDGSNSVMGIYITSSVNTTGTVLLGSGTPLSFSVQANVVTRIFLGSGSGTNTASVYYGSNSSVYINVVDGVKAESAVKINTVEAVVVYAHIIRSARSGATLVLPTQVLGNEYIAASMYSTSTSLPTSNGTHGGVSQITVVATQPNTSIEIKPSVTVNGHQAGVAYTVSLPNAGDVYQLQGSQTPVSGRTHDLSGTRISSKAVGNSGCKPIAVFSGSTWSTFDCSGATGGDNLFQQMFPVGSWGKTFVTAPFINRTDDIFRIFVKDAQTSVTIQENGVSNTLTAAAYNTAGGFYTYRSDKALIITASNPISVVQYITSASCKTGCSQTNSTNCYGDPEMVILSPVEQTLQDVTFFSAHSAFVPQGQTNIQQHYVNIIVSKAYKQTVKIDGAAPKGNFTDIPNSNYSFLQEDLSSSSATNPVHRVTADSGFAAIVYGYGNVESYGYNGGTNLKDFSAKPAFQTAFARIDSAVTCTNTPFEFSVPIGFQPTSIKWDFSAAPNISPSNTLTPQPAHDSVSNGVYYYSPKNKYSFSKANTATLRDTIKLYTTSATPDGCGSTDQIFNIPVKVNETPVSDFTVSHNGCIDDSVRLTDKSQYSGTITKWAWDFGDNTTESRSSAAEFGKKYTAASNYTIKLKAYTDIGCVSNETAKTVTVIQKPVANFSLQPALCENADVSFADASTSSGSPIAKWSWDLADGNPIIVNAANTPVKTKYTAWGNKNVRLAVETGNGCKSDTLVQVVKINPVPQIGFIIPEVCLNDASAQFEDTSKIAEGTIVSYAWQFNAGSPAVTPGPSTTTATGKKPAVKYNKSDNYKVSLTSTSDKGCVATGTKDFTVNGATPKAGFEMANNTPYCGIKPVQIKNTSTVDFGNVTRLEIFWDMIGQPTVKETDENPQPDKIYAHSFTDPSSPKQYTIRLVAYSGGNSCVSETSKTITLYPQPKAAFSASALQVCTGETVAFTDNSQPGSGTISAWHWDLGKGALSSAQNPSKMYNDSGAIPVSLYFLNSDGCISDTAMQTIQAYPNPQLVLPESQHVLEGGVTTLKPTWVFGNNLSFKWSPSTWLSSDTAKEPKSTPLNDITYTLVLTAEGGCSVSDEIFIRVLKGPEVPNAFSPNGDGINDLWNIKYLDGYPGATVDVYNRYGQIVYRSVGYTTPWNGTYQGKSLPVGTYYYIINPRNGRQTVTGAVTIIK